MEIEQACDLTIFSFSRFISEGLPSTQAMTETNYKVQFSVSESANQSIGLPSTQAMTETNYKVQFSVSESANQSIAVTE